MRYFVESYGCTMNYGEGSELSERMASMGYEEVGSADLADIVVLNTCTVVDATEKNMIRRMSELRRSGKEVIVTGCMAKVQPGRVSIRLPDSIILPPDRYSDFSRAVSERYGSEHISETYPRSNIISISQGCLGDCSYCITKFARGGLKSYPKEELLTRFKRMTDSGMKEILITSQDTGCYGWDIGTDLPSLIEDILDSEADVRIRIGMMNPNSLAPIINELLSNMADPRVYRFLHIPVQSGSDDVLKAMNRQYTVEDFKELVEKARSLYPEISISTDMICGFPGESEEDHKESLELMRWLNADTVNITRFSARPGTEAALMEPVHGRTSKQRSAEMTELKNTLEYNVNSKLVGKTFRVLVTEKGKAGTVIARTDNYRPIAFASDLSIGSFADVEVTGCEPTYLCGRMSVK